MLLQDEATALPFAFDAEEAKLIKEAFKSPLLRAYLRSQLHKVQSNSILDPDSSADIIVKNHAYTGGQIYVLESLLSDELYVPMHEPLMEETNVD